jgi:hypothetical protein
VSLDREDALETVHNVPAKNGGSDPFPAYGISAALGQPEMPPAITCRLFAIIRQMVYDGWIVVTF